ncbi:MAG TPA: CHAD domain-containing protein, partial [Polyangiaceae bacterium]
AHAPGNPKKAAPRLVRHYTHQEIWRRYESLRAYDSKMAPDVETLHKLRSQCRQMRFVLEAFADAIPGTHPIAERLHDFQSQIGQLHDHQIAIDLLRRWMKEGKLRSTMALERYLAQREKKRDQIRAHCERQWLEVFEPAFRRRLADALESEAA